MHPTTVIRKPLLTEKATMDAEMNNRYAFEVDRRANKAQIKYFLGPTVPRTNFFLS